MAKATTKPKPKAKAKAAPKRKVMAKSKTAAKMTRKPAAKAKAKPAAKAKAKPAARTKAKAKPRAMAKARTAPKARAKPAPAKRQSFIVSHYGGEADFKPDGLRPYAHYRDLGFAKATNGLAQAHVIRLIGPCDPKLVSKRHYHDVDFQMVYVLKGWMKNEFEGAGEQVMRAGSAWLQPTKIKHTVLDYSDDCEVLEIILPAEFNTKNL